MRDEKASTTIPNMSVVPMIEGERAFRVWPDVPAGAWDVIVIGSGMGGMSCAAACFDSRPYPPRVQALSPGFRSGKRP